MILSEERNKAISKLEELRNELRASGRLTNQASMSINSAISRILEDQISEITDAIDEDFEEDVPL